MLFRSAEQAQPGAAAADAPESGGDSERDNVVDAEFEEVKENKD